MKNKPLKVYVVCGSSGEYSDHREWYLCYYADKALAQRHVELAGAEDRRIQQWIIDHDYDTWSPQAVRACRNAWDHLEDNISYRPSSGNNYGVAEVGLGPIKAQLRRIARVAA